MSEVKVPRGDAGGVLDDLVRRVGDLERRMRVRGDGRLKLAADDPGATLLEFLSTNYGGSSSLPKSWCQEVYNGQVDSFSLTEADSSGSTASYFFVVATVIVTNGTGSSGLVELQGAFTRSGSTLSASDLVKLTMANGEAIRLTDACTIEANCDVGYQVTNIGSTNASVNVNVTVVEVDAQNGACCTGGG